MQYILFLFKGCLCNDHLQKKLSKNINKPLCGMVLFRIVQERLYKASLHRLSCCLAEWDLFFHLPFPLKLKWGLSSENASLFQLLYNVCFLFLVISSLYYVWNNVFFYTGWKNGCQLDLLYKSLQQCSSPPIHACYLLKQNWLKYILNC